jgi:hypothetical protein
VFALNNRIFCYDYISDTVPSISVTCPVVYWGAERQEMARAFRLVAAPQRRPTLAALMLRRHLLAMRCRILAVLIQILLQIMLMRTLVYAVDRVLASKSEVHWLKSTALMTTLGLAARTDALQL